MNQLVGQSVCW